MKVLICYNDNDDKSIHKTLRITVPGSWRTKSTMADLLNQYVTSFNAYHRKKILSVENTHLATRQAVSPSDEMAFIGEEMIRTTSTKKKINTNDDTDDGSDQYCYVSYANDTKLAITPIRDRAKLYVRHNLPVLHSSSSSNSVSAKNYQVEYNNDNGVDDDERFEAEVTYRVIDDESKEKSLVQEQEEEEDVEIRDEADTVPPPILPSSSHTVGMMRKTISTLIGIRKGPKAKETSPPPTSPQRFANTMYGLNVDDNDTSNQYGKKTTTVPVSSNQPDCEAAPTNYGDKFDEDSEEDNISRHVVGDEEEQVGDDDDDDDDDDVDDDDDFDEFNNKIVYSIVDENVDKPWLQKLERTETRDEVEILPPTLPTSMRKSSSMPSAAHGINSSKKGSRTANVSARALSPKRLVNNFIPILNIPVINNRTTTTTQSLNMTVVPTTSIVSTKDIGGNGNVTAIAPEKRERAISPIVNAAATTARAAVKVSASIVLPAIVSTVAAPVAVASKPVKIHPNTDTSTNVLSNILGRALRPRSRSVSPRKINRFSAEVKATANDILSSSLHNHQTSTSPPMVHRSSAAIKATTNNSLSQSLHDDQKPTSSPMVYRSSAEVKGTVNNSLSHALLDDQTSMSPSPVYRSSAEVNATANGSLLYAIGSDQKPMMMNSNTAVPTTEVTSKSVLTSKETNTSNNGTIPTISKEMKKRRNVLSFLLRGKKKTKEVTEVPSSTDTCPNTQQTSLDAYAVTVNEGSHNQDKSENPTGVEISDNSLHTSSVVERYDGGEFAAETEPRNNAPTFRRIDTIDSIGMGQSFGTAYSMEDLSRFKTYLKRSGVVEDASLFDEMVHEMKVKKGESNAAIKTKMQSALKESFRNAMIAMRSVNTDGAVAMTRVSSPRGGIGLDTILEDGSDEKEPTTTTNPRKAPLIIDTADAATAQKKNKVYDDFNTIAGGTHLNRDIYVDSSGSLAGSSLVSPTQWIVPTPYPQILSPPIGPIRNAVNNLCGAAENFPGLTCKNGNENDVISDDAKKFDFILVNQDDQFSPVDDDTELRETMMFEQAVPVPVPDTTSATGAKFVGLDLSQHTLVTGVRDFCNDAAAVAANTGAIIRKQTNMYKFNMNGTNWEEKFASKYEVCGCNLSIIRDTCRM